ncbi:MAG: family 43 glycosylhydrolase [Verrucomicrobiota bacterium]
MRIPVNTLPCLIALLFASSGALPAQPPPAREAVFDYTNPLDFSYQYFDGKTSHTEKELRDPCIIREGDTYYLVFTMYPFRGRDERHLEEVDMGSSPGIQMFSSKDFKAWKTGNWLVKSSELPPDCPYKHRFWAPEIHKIKGKFYVIFTADNWVDPKYNLDGKWGMYTYIGVADSVTGPYEHITRIPYGPCDTTLFCDSDGTFYVIMPKGEIYIQKLDLSGLEKGVIKRVGEEKRIVTKSNADIGVAVSTTYLEGPWLEHMGNKYVLFFAAPYPDRSPDPEYRGYWVGAACADQIMGPYQKDPRGKVFFGGHIAVFDGPDGRKWFSYRWERDNRARGLLCIDPMDLDKNGRIQATDHLGEATVPMK